MTLKQEADSVQLQDPLRIITKDNDYIEIMSDGGGILIISVYGRAIITQDFLESMQNHGYRLERIFNAVDTYSVPENANDILNYTKERPTVPPFIETTLHFEDIYYIPILETSCRKCGRHEEGEGSTEDGEENENPSGEGIGDTNSVSYHNLTTTADKNVKSPPPPSEEEK
jgi:hypothetical protein